jgi:KTSC domain-containing protein
VDRYHVQSSTIRGIGYDPQTCTLEVYFFQGGSYRYVDVPEFVLQAFLRAPSKGEYFNRCIVDRYRFEEIH